MTANRFEPLEPYNIDPDDATTRGRLFHAAKRGDARARLTLRNLDRAARQGEAPDAHPDPAGDVEHRAPDHDAPSEQPPGSGDDPQTPDPEDQDDAPPARPTVADGRRLRAQRRRGPAWDRQAERDPEDEP